MLDCVVFGIQKVSEFLSVCYIVQAYVHIRPTVLACSPHIHVPIIFTLNGHFLTQCKSGNIGNDLSLSLYGLSGTPRSPIQVSYELPNMQDEKMTGVGRAFFLFSICIYSKGMFYLVTVTARLDCFAAISPG